MALFCTAIRKIQFLSKGFHFLATSKLSCVRCRLLLLLLLLSFLIFLKIGCRLLEFSITDSERETVRLLFESNIKAIYNHFFFKIRLIFPRSLMTNSFFLFCRLLRINLLQPKIVGPVKQPTHSFKLRKEKKCQPIPLFPLLHKVTRGHEPIHRV